MNRRLIVPLAAVALAAAAGGATFALVGADSASSENESSGQARATATVERRDLVQQETVDGTLGYADSATLYAPAMGTVTALRDPGSVAKRGQALYWLDGEPVTLMYGQVPMWRRLDVRSSDGPDIRQLERNLVALGHDPNDAIEIDEEWDTATTAAVKRWQEDRGLTEDGAVEPGQIAFLSGPRRIGEAKTTVGALLQPGSEILETTATRRIVTIDLDADKQSLVAKGDRVAVELPDGRSVNGTVAEVGRVAESETDPQTGEQTDPTIPVEIRLPRGVKTGGLDQTPVDVSLEKARVKKALTAPVSALLALTEGGYAVEVVNRDGSTRLVRVQLGTFADDDVEISGKGIKKGMRVVVPS